MQHKILVVDDDSSIRKLISSNLRQRGYAAIVASDGLDAIDQFKQEEPDLIILDLVMPGLEGVDVCRWVRSQSNIPILVLSAHDDETQIVQALDAGADDYITKPFGMEELLARVRSSLRRAYDDSNAIEDPVLQLNDLRIDLEAHRVQVHGVDLHMTRTEFALLAELVKNIDKVVTHDDLIRNVWGVNYEGSHQYLYVYFGRIRNKLGDEYAQLLETVPGVGYLLNSQA